MAENEGQEVIHEEMEEEVEEILPEAIPIDWSKDVPLPSWVQQADSTQKPNETWILEVTESGAPAGRISLDRYTTVLGSGAKVHRNHCHVLVTSATEGEADEGTRDIELCHAAVALNPASCDVFRGMNGGTTSTSTNGQQDSGNGNGGMVAGSTSSSSSSSSTTTSGTSKRNKLDFSLIDLNSHTGTKLNGRIIDRGACVSLRAGDKFSLGESNKVFRLVRGVAAVHEKKSFALSLAKVEELSVLQTAENMIDNNASSLEESSSSSLIASSASSSDGVNNHGDNNNNNNSSNSNNNDDTTNNTNTRGVFTKVYPSP